MSAVPWPQRLAVMLALLMLASPAAGTSLSATASPHRATGASARGADPVIAAAGDIACSPSNPYFNGGSGSGRWCRASKTARLIADLAPTAVLALGDAQYDSGTLHQYDASYALNWGGAMPITHPAPGNHDYLSSTRARGYFSYFGAAAAPSGPLEGYYSYDLGAWHLISLNSNCSFVHCASGSAQYTWLKSDLIANAGACTLAYWHAPRYSSGPHGNYLAVQPFWHLLYRYGADVVLNGHDHIYERFKPMGDSGRRDAHHGIREFVVGTGGAQHYWINAVKPNSVVRNAKTFGLLAMTLHPTGYDWTFEPIAGSSFTDVGTGECHGVPHRSPT